MTGLLSHELHLVETLCMALDMGVMHVCVYVGLLSYTAKYRSIKILPLAFFLSIWRMKKYGRT